MHRSTKSGKIQPIHMAMRKSQSSSHRPDRRLQRQGAFRSRSPRSTIEASQPSRPSDTPTLRTQLFRVAASEDADGTHATPDPSAVDTEVEYEQDKDTPPPMTPPPMSNKQLGHFDPTAAVPEEIPQRFTVSDRGTLTADHHALSYSA